VSVDISRVGVNTVFKGALQVNENISVTGDITVSGTVNGIDIPTNTTGVVTVHSDVTSAGSGAIISGAERTAIGTNNTNNTGVVTVHSDVTSAGSGIIISAAERTAIGTNTTNNAGVITVHSDVTSAGSGIIISAAERTQIGTNIANATTSINAHSDISTNILVDDDILAYNSTGGEWENKTIAALGLAAATHTHTPTDITDFDSATDLQIASQKGINNGIASLVAGKIPASQLAVTNLNKCGAWNADTNDPTLTSSVGVSGCIYVVSDAGSTDLNGITDWKVNDWVVFNGSVWEKVDNTNVVASVAGKTGAVTLISTDITDITSGGSGAIITGVERTAIGTNTSNNTGVVTVHSDVTDAGSGAIITGVERTAIGTNTTNNTGSVTVHSDVTSAGSGAIITSAERIAIAGGIGGTVDIHSDITSAGSGAIITGVERTAIGTNTTNNSGPVTVHSDVTSVGSGAIITGVERTAIGTNTTNNNGVVTVHSDVTDAGSGAIISGAERTAIGTNATNATLKMDLGGGVMAGDIDMGNADFKNITNQTLKGELTLGIAESAQRVIKTASGNNIVIENFTGASALTIKHQGGIDVSGVVSLSDTTNSTSTTSGSIVTTGGVGVAKKVNVGELIRLTHQSTTPSAPATGKGFIYVRNSTLYFMGDNGVEKTIATT
jgi:hypothetical protein